MERATARFAEAGVAASDRLIIGPGSPGHRGLTSATKNWSARNMTEITQHGVQSIEVGMKLLDLMAEGPPEITLSALAAAAGMPPSKAHRYLVSLTRAGFVEQKSATHLYRLGANAFALGTAALRRLDITELGASVLRELCDETGLTVSMAVWANHGPTVIRVAESTTTMVITVRVGTVLPLLTSANGQIYLAYRPRSETKHLIDAELSANRSKRKTSADERLLTTMKQVEEAASEVRKWGVSRSYGMTVGLVALGAPIFDYRGELACSIALIGSEGQLDPSMESKDAVMVKDVAMKLSEKLGYGRQGPFGEKTD